MSKFFTGFAAVTASVLVLSGCAGGDTGNGNGAPTGDIVPGGDFVFAIAADVDTLDPTIANFYAARQVLSSVCEKLYEIDEDVVLQPQLAAELPEVSEDGMTVTIALREDAVFNDGTPFNAEAVKTSLDRHLSHPMSVRLALQQNVDSVEVVDEYTVQLNLNNPFSPLTAELADYSGNMMSPAALEELGDDFGTSPVCVGPFEFVQRTPGSEIRLQKAEQYYDADKVNLDTLTYRVIPDPNVRASNLEAGDIHASETMSTVSADRFKNSSTVVIDVAKGLGYAGVTFNIGNVAGVGNPSGEIDTPMGQSQELRTAFEMALDRQQLNDSVFFGYHDTSCSPISEASPFHFEVDCTGYDPDGARELVEASGYDMPVPVTLMSASTGEAKKLAEVIQSMANAVGFDVQIETVEGLTAILSGRSGDFDALSTGWTGRIDADGNLNGTITTGGSNTYSGYSNPEVDELIFDAAKEPDQDKRIEMYQEATEIFLESRAFIYLYNTANIMGHSADVVVPVHLAHGTVRLKEAGFVE